MWNSERYQRAMSDTRPLTESSLRTNPLVDERQSYRPLPGTTFALVTYSVTH
jgi:hypothetical protein